MQVEVKTQWKGFVSVASRYVEHAILHGEGLSITCNGSVITVPLDILKGKKPREGSFNDKFGRSRDYKLYDFFWTDYIKQ